MVKGVHSLHLGLPNISLLVHNTKENKIKVIAYETKTTNGRFTYLKETQLNILIQNYYKLTIKL